MALITGLKDTSSWVGGAPLVIKDRASRFYLEIPSIYLSQAYDLKTGDKVEGEILVVKSIEGKEYPELKGREIELIIFYYLESDYLFITKIDWEENFREYGLVTNFRLSVRLNKAIRKDGTEIPLYTKKDIEL